MPLDCKREWRRKGGCSGGFLSDGETEQVFRLRGEASGDSGLGKKLRMPLVQEVRLQVSVYDLLVIDINLKGRAE